MNLRSTVRWLGLAALLVTSPVMGSAATVRLEQTGATVFGNNAHAAVTITNTDPNQRVTNLRVLAGGFAVTDGRYSFTAWCLDIITNLRLPSDYDVTTAPFPNRRLTERQTGNIERLFETAFKTLNLRNAAQSAGFQLALWEIVNEGMTRAFSLSDGNFTATNSSAAITFGQGLLNGLAPFNPISQNYTPTYFASNDRRNRIDSHYSQHLVGAVPLPAAGWLMLAALGGIAALRRRKAV